MRSIHGDRPSGARVRGSERGSALLFGLLALLLMSAIALSMAQSSMIEYEISGNFNASQAAFYAADGGIQSFFNEIVTMTGRLGRFPTRRELRRLVPPVPGSAQVASSEGRPVGPITTDAITSGPFQGLVASTQEFDATLTAETTGYPRGESTIAMRALVDLIPVFQFAAFYERDLELHPGALMTIAGRVHTNEDIYLTSAAGLYFDANVTAAGTFNWGKKISGALYADDVYFTDADSNYVAMSGLDSSHADWHDEAIDRWDGNVKSDVHGVTRLELTLPDPSRPRGLVEPGLSSDGPDAQITKMLYKSEIRIVNGVARDDAGNAVSTIDPVTGEDAVRFTVIDDARERHPMLTYEVDMELLGRSPAWPGNGTLYVGLAEPGDGIPAWGGWPAAWNGYTAPYNGGNTEFAVKLMNGSELASPLTVISENPVYVRGDYNRVNKKGAAVIADTVTLLSNSWGRRNAGGTLPADAPDDDLGYSDLSLSSRRATSTVYNLSIMGGNTETTASQASGGLHNVLRYLERWTGQTSTFLGSIVILWYSEHAYSDWYCCPSNGFYTPPIRDYAFDADYLDPANLPPNTPSALQVRVTSWRRQ